MEGLEKEIRELKRELFDLEKTFYHEREVLIGLINTLAVAAARFPGISQELEAIKDKLDPTQELPVEEVETHLKALKTKILATDVDTVVPEDLKKAKELKETVVAACRILRRVIMSVTEDLYPLDKILTEKAADIDITCKGTVTTGDFDKASKAFLGFVGGLREKIEDDFRYINETFGVFLDQIKELEKSLTKEFGGEERLNEIEYFEMNINQEMGSIIRSLDIHTTIEEIKVVVMEKIRRIKEVVSLRKKREMERARAAKENIEQLQQRIAEAERQAQEMSKKAEELQTVAMKDGLTGLYNRKAFGLRINSTLRRTSKTGERFSLILFDIDRFKAINDTFGHVAGDKVLKKVAECLRGSFRENDFIARYGGDEFAVLVEKMDHSMALERVENFRKNLSKLRFISHKKGELRLTVSSGVAEACPDDTPETLIERADEAMYDEKNRKNIERKTVKRWNSQTEVIP